jgi:glycosyltransferase involved in cell wall biosynthesis
VKILHVVQGYSPAIGGTEWLIQRVSEELVQRYGDDVTVFTTNCYNGAGIVNPRLPTMPAGFEEINGVHIRRFPVMSWVSQSLKIPQWFAYRLNLPYEQKLRTWHQGPIVPGLKKAIRESDAELVAASSFPLVHMYDAMDAAKATGRPCVLHGGIHPQDSWGFQRPMIYQAVARADEYIANTEYEANYVIKRGADPDRVTAIGVGVNPEPFMCTSPDTAKVQLGLTGGPVVGFIGQFSWHKGVNTLVEAMNIVWSIFPTAILLLAGSRTPYASKIEAMINQLPEERRSRVKLNYNFQESEKPLLFASTDVFAYPSGFESFGIAFIEAWAAGKPVIGCRRGAIPWVVNAGKDGILVSFGDEALLAEAIIHLLQNPGWAQAMGEAGRMKVIEKYTWKVVADRFREVYEKALHQARFAEL